MNIALVRVHYNIVRKKCVCLAFVVDVKNKFVDGVMEDINIAK